MMDFDWTLLAIVAGLVALDIVTGFSAAVNRKDVNSSIMRAGLWHKLSYLYAIALGYLVELAIPIFDSIPAIQQWGIVVPEFPAVSVVCVFIALIEIVSVCENLVEINPKMGNLPGFGVLAKRDDKGVGDGE